MDEYHRLPDFRREEERSVARVREYPNGSIFEVIPGTINALSGPKSQTVVLDEVEFMKWENLQQSLGMAHSAHGIPAAMLFGSTRQRIYGSMNRLSQHAAKMGLDVAMWCIWETMAPCEIRNPSCPLWARCRGGSLCQNEDGYIPVDDVITKAGLADEEVWQTQYECSRPSRRGLVFDTFDPSIHVRGDLAEYQPRLPVYLGGDWGYSHPAAVLFFQFRGGVLYQFDEIYVQRKLNDQVLALALAKIQQYGIVQVTAGWGDPEDPDAQTRFRRGLGRCQWNNGEIEIEKRLLAVRERLKTALGDIRYYVHPRCINTINEFSLYHYREVGMGTDGEPLYAEEPEDADNHAMDSLGYVCAGLKKSGRPSMADVIRVTALDPTRPQPPRTWPAERPAFARTKQF